MTKKTRTHDEIAEISKSKIFSELIKSHLPTRRLHESQKYVDAVLGVSMILHASTDTAKEMLQLARDIADSMQFGMHDIYDIIEAENSAPSKESSKAASKEGPQ